MIAVISIVVVLAGLFVGWMLWPVFVSREKPFDPYSDPGCHDPIDE